MGFRFNPFINKLDKVGVEEGSTPTFAGATINGWLVTEPIQVGGIYLNMTGVNPATELGYGTWTQVAQGQILVGDT
jgi:hypothetical protein